MFEEQPPMNPNGTPDVHGAYLEKLEALAQEFREAGMNFKKMVEEEGMSEEEVLRDLNDELENGSNKIRMKLAKIL